MPDYMGSFFNAVTAFQTQYAGLFGSMGMNLFRAFSLIIISWFGIQSALSGEGFSLAKFSSAFQQMMFCYVMIAFYTVPIPGIGVSFTHLILDQSQSMVSSINQARVQEVVATLNDLESNLAYPTLLEPISIIRFFVLALSIAAAQAAMLSVVMFGYVATAIILLLGPVFIPFKIVPEMEWMFWGWLRSFLQYSFYQVVATAYVFIFGQFLLQFLGTTSGPLSSADTGVMFVPLVMMLVTFVLGIIKVPALVFSIFAGRAGDYVQLWWRR